jgi:uridine phosphorylase
LFIYHLSLDLDDVPTHSAVAAGTMGKIQKIAESWTNANGGTLYEKKTPADEHNANLMM